MTQKKKQTAVTTRTRALTSLEEKVVRMRHGLTAPHDLILEQVGQNDPEVAAQLREIEERALQAVSARRSPTKRRIVKALRSKDS